MALSPEGFLDGLRESVKMIWEERPEYVFELGDMTTLAALCQPFTTVVTMNCVKSAPVTAAPIVARYFEYSKEDNDLFYSCLTAEQTVIDVKHEEESFEHDTADNREIHKKQDFGISGDAFVIIIAGNRLDIEITDEFLKVLYGILERNERFTIVVIGLCERLKQTVTESGYGERIVFTGVRRDFKETISIGDVFLNPPRQGGGTGAVFAGEMGIPVITLDHCDVESFVGQDFVCESVDKMPDLLDRYFMDHEFYEKQKERIKNRMCKHEEIDSIGNFGKLCELVKKVAIEKERRTNGC